MAARSENVEKIISKYYKKKIILIDRFVDSTMAYQHHGMGLNKDVINKINFFLLDNIKPDFTFLNKISKKSLIKRLKIRKNKNRYDRFNFSFYNKVQKGFLNLSKNNYKYMIVNSDLNLSYNKKKIIKKIKVIIK